MTNENKNIDKGNEKIHEALELLNQAAKEKREVLTKLMSGGYEDMKETMGDVIEKSGKTFMRAKKEAEEKLRDTAETVNTSVHHNPWPFIGGAALCGLVIGLFINPRR